MSTDPLELIPKKDVPARDETEERRRDRLNNLVAVTIALLATFMGICKVKGDNIAQAMEQAQVDRNNNWAWYQARNIRKEVLEVATQEMAAQHRALGATEAGTGFQALAEKFDKLAKEQETKMEGTKAQAEADASLYTDLNLHDDQFDLMEAGLSVAIAMFAITSLTHSLMLYIVALFPAAFGVVMGIAGLLGWSLHPASLAKLLGT